MNKDTLIVVLSDMHSGGSTALFPNRFWQSTTTEHNHTPTKKQQDIYKHFEDCIFHALTRRKGRRLIVVHDGDAVEGIHHDSTQTIAKSKQEQAEIHIELMDVFLRGVRFKKSDGDLLYYVSGTETHVGDWEQKIAKDLSAKRNPEGGYVFDHLELDVNGRLLWMAHHGKKRGAGANEGNALRNFLRDVYWDCRKLEQQPPDFVVTGHTHTPTYNTYVVPHGKGYHTMHGVICPSWQMKTRFAYKIAPVERNEIGAVYIGITANGEVQTPEILKRETAIGKTLKIT